MVDRRKKTSTASLERRRRNRRAFPRWVLDFDVELQWDNQSTSCRGYEISEGGLSVVCEQEIPREIEIEIEYRLPGSAAAVNVKGTVRHVERNRYGIEFLNLGMKERLALVEYCEKSKTV
jgi:c-di-GMP-binding flagellar brake protein YcgR